MTSHQILFSSALLILTCGCTSMSKSSSSATGVAHYRRSMSDGPDVASSADGRSPASDPASDPAPGAASAPGADPVIRSYGCSSADSKTKFTLSFGAKEATLFIDGGGRGSLFDAQPGEINLPPETDVLAVDGLGDANTLYYVALPKLNEKMTEWPDKLNSQLIVKKTGEPQAATEAACSKN